MIFLKRISISWTIPAVVKRYATNSSSPKPFSEIPTPKGALPFLGHSLRLRKDFNETVKRMFEEANSPILRLKIPGSSIVFTNDPDGAKDIYSSEGRYPVRNFEEKMQWFYKTKRNDEPAIFFLTGPKWRERRSDLGKQLIPANVYGYVPGFIKATDRLIRNVEEMQDSEGYINDMQELIIYWTLEVGAWFGLGAELDARLNHRTEAQQLKQIMNVIVEITNKFAFSIPFYKIFPTPILKKANEAFDKRVEIGLLYADKHMERIMQGVKKGEIKYGQSLLEQWLIEGNLSKKDASHTAMVMLSAGFETTASLISFALYEVSKRRDVQNRIYDQVVSVLGEDGEPDKESLQKMPYLTNVIKEAQRMGSVISGHIRKLPHDATILGYTIPAGTVVIYHMFTANQSSSIYKDPEKFDPDRWSTDEINPYASIPFGIGPRMCWGRRFAEIEMKVLLAKLCQHFLMDSDDPVEARMPYDEATVLRPADSIKIKFTRRKY